MPTPQRWRLVMIVLIIVILLSCTISAILGLRGGHATRAARTFFAGLSFSILFWTRLRKRVE